MALEQYKVINFKPAKLAAIQQANEIIDEYLAQGLRLTLRQLYYQHVARGLIENNLRSYKNLGNLLSDARLAGLVDWDAIEDRTRGARMHPEYNDLAELVNSALARFRLPRWAGQKNYVELWVEKDALAGVLMPLANEFHVALSVNRGYSSSSAMHEAALRFLDRTSDGQKPILLYLGDHDPSGLDMTRDIAARMEMFGVTDIDVRHVALTTAQVRQHNPPPNPVKLQDSRATAYIADHGQTCWEVDALNPTILARLIRGAIRPLVNQAMMDRIIEQEDVLRDRLTEATQNIKLP